MNDYRLIYSHDIFQLRNLLVEWNNWIFDIVYGETDNGWFVTVNNHNISCFIGLPDDLTYNVCRLQKKFEDVKKARLVAQAIKDDWEAKKNGN